MADPAAASQPLIRSVADTALWAAVFRARETERERAAFRDPFARRLAGERGDEIADGMPGDAHAWAWITRTYLFDQIIAEQLEQGVDMVVNLAAGLDARPYRMLLPRSLQWVEVDLPDVIDYKRTILEAEAPGCSLERYRLDLSDVAARHDLFQELSLRSSKTLVLSEGLLLYLSSEQVTSLAQDLAEASSFDRWVLELCSPGLLKMLTKQWGSQLGRGDATPQFAPREGPDFFSAEGWAPLEVRSVLRTAVRLGRTSFWMRMLSRLPESSGPQGSRPWSGVCLLGRRR